MADAALQGSTDDAEALPPLPLDLMMPRGNDDNAAIITSANLILLSLGVLGQGGGGDRVKELVRLTGGCTNVIYRVDTTKGQNFLLRVFGVGTEMLIDRRREACCFRAVAIRGLGPKLLGTFGNGRVEEFLQARPLTAVEMRSAAISRLLGPRLRSLHAIATVEGLDDHPHKKKEASLFPQLRAWIALIRQRCTEEGEEKQRQNGKGNGDKIQGARLCCRGWDLLNLEEEIERLEHRLVRLNSPICLCHNDLNHLNLLLKECGKKDDEEGGRSQAQDLIFVDLEYAGWNYRGFDLGNHLCEWASNFHSSAPHVLDFERHYPTLQEQRVLAKAYLTMDDHHPPDENDVEALIHEMNEFALASHLFWGLWGLLQSQMSSLDFDFVAYANQRLEQYYKRIRG